MEKLLSDKEVGARTSLSRTERYRREKEDRFPKRIVIGPNRVAWIESEIDAWVREQIELARGIAA